MKISKIFVSAIILTIFGASRANAQSLSDLLGGNLGSTVSNFVEGVFSSSNLTVADLAGEWNATGPAVCFQSDNFLKKAGGIAAATAVENKLAPYYDKLGLNNATITIDRNGAFTFVSGKLPKMSGTITEAAGSEKGVFNFNFQILGMNAMSVTTYVQKTSTSMDIMFDASKLKALVGIVAKIANNTLLSTASSILDSYEGLCIGFHFKGVSESSSSSSLGGILNSLGIGNGKSQGTTTNGESSGSQNKSAQSSETGQSGTTNGNDKISSGLELLKGILRK